MDIGEVYDGYGYDGGHEEEIAAVGSHVQPVPRLWRMGTFQARVPLSCEGIQRARAK
jgi:hypothetical protein